MSGSQGYAAVPNWLVDDESFTYQEKLVYLVMQRHADKYGSAFPGVKRIAEKAGISESSVKRAIARLRKVGLLEVVQERRYGGSRSESQATVYKVHTSLPTPTSGLPDLRSELSTGQGDLRSQGAELTDDADLRSGRPLNKTQKNNPSTTRGVRVVDDSPSVAGGENVATSPAGAVEKSAPRGPLPRADRCAAHQHVALPGNCGDCADARKTLELVERDVAARPLPKCKHNVPGGCRFDPGRDLAHLEDAS